MILSVPLSVPFRVFSFFRGSLFFVLQRLLRRHFFHRPLTCLSTPSIFAHGLRYIAPFGSVGLSARTSCRPPIQSQRWQGKAAASSGSRFVANECRGPP